MGKTIDKVVNVGKKVLVGSVFLIGSLGCVQHYHVQPSIPRHIPSSQRKEIQSNLLERFKEHLKANCDKYWVNPTGFYCKKTFEGRQEYPYNKDYDIITNVKWCDIKNAAVLGDALRMEATDRIELHSGEYVFPHFYIKQPYETNFLKSTQFVQDLLDLKTLYCP